MSAKYTLFLFLAVAHNLLFAQYNLLTKVEKYTELEQDIVISPAKSWLEFGKEITLPFKMKMFEEESNVILITNDGIELPETAFLSAFFHNDYYLCDKNYEEGTGGSLNAASKISYTLSGQQGKRILKVQYKNLKVELNPKTDDVNFQIWYYESDGNIEYRYSKCLVDPKAFSESTPGILAFVTSESESNSQVYFINGDSKNPTGGYLEGNVDEALYLNSIPDSGTVYVLKPGKVSINKNITTTELTLWPNPTQDILNIKSASTLKSISVLSLTGQVLLSLSSGGKTAQINCTELPNGIYFVKIETSEGVRCQKFIKR